MDNLTQDQKITYDRLVKEGVAPNIAFGVASRKNAQTNQVAKKGILESLASVANNIGERITDIPQDISQGFNNVKETITGSLDATADSWQRMAQGKQNIADTIIQTAGNTAKIASGGIGESFATVGKLFTTPKEEESIKNAISGVVEGAMDTDIAKWAFSKYGKWKELNPTLAADAEAVGNVGMLALDLLGLGAASKTGSAFRSGAKEVLEEGAEVAVKNLDNLENVFYHGTSIENKRSILKDGWDPTKSIGKNNEQPAALFVSTDPFEASMYGKSELVVRPKNGASIKVLEGSSQEWADTLGKSRNSEETAKIYDDLRSRGYDLVDEGDEQAILNPEKFDFIDMESSSDDKIRNLVNLAIEESDLPEDEIIDHISRALKVEPDEVMKAIEEVTQDFPSSPFTPPKSSKSSLKDFMPELPAALGNTDDLTRRASETGIDNINRESLKTAVRRGFSEEDAVFLSSLGDADKVIMNEMRDLAEKATVNKRALYGTRPIDIVGKNLSTPINKLLALQPKLGKAVNEAAQSLKGETIDPSRLTSSLDEILESAGITKGEKGLSFDNTAFEFIPEVQKTLVKTIDQIYKGVNTGDAYRVHNLKKAIDEAVNYAKEQEGLTGAGQNLIKKMRRAIDDVLDEDFIDYNDANTEFTQFQEFIEDTEALFGKNRSITGERAAAKMRAIFSNREMRGDIKEYLSKLDDFASRYEVEKSGNLYDQALLSEILEEMYGTQAVTSLRGETEKALKGVQRVISGIRNPVQGAGDLIAAGVEKITGQTDEGRREFLRELLSN